MTRRKLSEEEKKLYARGQVNEKGQPICGALSVRTGKPCQGKPMPNGRCLQHGGKTPTGILHHNYKVGKGSKYMPERLLERYHEFLNGKDLLSLESSIALLDTRMSELIERIDNDQAAPSTWIELNQLWTSFMLAVRSGNAKEQNKLLPLINQLIEHGSAQEKLWYDIESVSESQRKLIESERKRMVEAQQMISIEQAIILVTTVINALKEVVYKHADPKTAKEIIIDASTHYQRVLGPTDST